jgi:aminodeoxyfutalosine synthase
MDRVSKGDRLSPDEIRDLAGSPDVLSLGMLADTFRRGLHGNRTTFLRVAEVELGGDAATSVPPAAREVRLTGSAGDLDGCAAAIGRVRDVAGDRTIAGLSWSDVEGWSQRSSVPAVLKRLKDAGLDAVAELPLDAMTEPAVAVQHLRDAGFARLRLTINKGPAESRTELLLRAFELQEASGIVQSLNPLPMMLSTFRPTTGYEDVKMVALARLAAPNIQSIQVDWRRYGPKLAQVALTFGADDIDGVSASDDAPEGRRRAPRVEIERNVQAAGFTPAERDGRFNLL